MKLVEARVRRALSVRELSRQAGVSARTIYAIEHGEVSPSLSTIRKLSNVLGLEPIEVDEFRMTIERIVGEEMGSAALAAI
jgi:transcriptional regulator with XRE-family HTH domain